MKDTEEILSLYKNVPGQIQQMWLQMYNWTLLLKAGKMQMNHLGIA